MGLLLALTLTATNVQDQDAVADVAAQACAKAPGLTMLYIDGACGKWTQAIEQTHGLRVQVVRRSHARQDTQLPLWSDIAPKTGFVVQAVSATSLL